MSGLGKSACCLHGMKNRYRKSKVGFDHVERLVQCVVADHETIGTEPNERFNFLFQERGDFIPSVMIVALDFVIVDAPQQDVGRVETAEPALRELVQYPLVLDRGRPARAAEQPYCFHLQRVVRFDPVFIVITIYRAPATTIQFIVRRKRL